MAETDLIQDENDRRIVELQERMTLTPSSFVAVDSTDHGTRKYDLGTLVQGISGSFPVWDAEDERYTNESIAAWLAARRDGLAYGISIPKSAVVACTKTGANAGLVNPTPGTEGTPAVDPYVGRGPFLFLNVNGYVDADGMPYVTAIEGDGRFRRDGTNGDVWVLTPMIWWSQAETAEAVDISISDTRLSGMEPWPRAYLPSGELRPYLLFAKYQGVMGADGFMHSYSGHPVWNYTVSHNSLITQCRTATTGYSGRTEADLMYVQLMCLLKYATKDFNTVMYGCLNYNLQYPVTVAAANVTYVVISKANAANLLVGSSVIVGTYSAGNLDRGQATMHDVCDATRILGIEDHDSNNSRVYLDLAATITTEVGHYVSTAPWHTGACDKVEGDGSPTSPTSGKEPFVIQGLEVFCGVYDVLGTVIISSPDASTGQIPHVNPDSRDEATSLTSVYVSCGDEMPENTGTGNANKYPTWVKVRDGLMYGTDASGSQTTGMGDAHYVRPKSATGTNELLSGGSLVGARLGGPFCVYALSALSVANWNVGSRLSALGRSRG